MARARSYAERAIELAPDLADSRTALGTVQYFGDWDWEGAERSYRRALDLDPGYVLAHQQYAILLAHQQRFDEALRHLERARDLSPLAFDARGVNPGLIHEILGEGERAVAYWQEAIEIGHGFRFNEWERLIEESGESFAAILTELKKKRED